MPLLGTWNICSHRRTKERNSSKILGLLIPRKKKKAEFVGVIMTRFRIRDCFMEEEIDLGYFILDFGSCNSNIGTGLFCGANE